MLGSTQVGTEAMQIRGAHSLLCCMYTQATSRLSEATVLAAGAVEPSPYLSCSPGHVPRTHWLEQPPSFGGKEVPCTWVGSFKDLCSMKLAYLALLKAVKDPA